MKVIRRTSGPRLSIALTVAGALLSLSCGDSSTGISRTAPVADAVTPSPAGLIGDRSYTWSLKCSGDLSSSASWSWTAAGVPIAGTEASTNCSAGTAISGAGTRPAAADGFSACVDANGVNYWSYGTCQTWTFDPAGAFKAQLKDSDQVYDFNRCGFSWGRGHGGNGNNCWLKATGTLAVDS